jgi:hypothetical protein
VNCYRLSWKDANNREHVSDVVCLNNEVKNALSNIVLRNSGELLFVLNSSQSSPYAFRLLTTDGKLVAKAVQQVIFPGTNRIRFPKALGRNTIFLLQAIGSSEERSLLLRVE